MRERARERLKNHLSHISTSKKQPKRSRPITHLVAPPPWATRNRPWWKDMLPTQWPQRWPPLALWPTSRPRGGPSRSRLLQSRCRRRERNWGSRRRWVRGQFGKAPGGNSWSYGNGGVCGGTGSSCGPKETSWRFGFGMWTWWMVVSFGLVWTTKN